MPIYFDFKHAASLKLPENIGFKTTHAKLKYKINAILTAASYINDLKIP